MIKYHEYYNVCKARGLIAHFFLEIERHGHVFLFFETSVVDLQVLPFFSSLYISYVSVVCVVSYGSAEFHLTGPHMREKGDVAARQRDTHRCFHPRVESAACLCARVSEIFFPLGIRTRARVSDDIAHTYTQIFGFPQKIRIEKPAQIINYRAESAGDLSRLTLSPIVRL